MQHWTHCARKDNPADMPSLGITPKNLDSSLTWRHEPDWLPKFTSTKLNDNLPMPEDCSVELRTNACHSLLTAIEDGGIGRLMECKQYSKLQKLLRVTTLVKKVAAQFKVVKHDIVTVDFTVTAADIDNAELD